MQQQSLRDGCPLRPWHQLLQIFFYTFGIIRFGQSKPLGHAFHMGIDNNTGLSKCISQNDIRRFSADARQCNQFLHCLRNLRLELFGHGLAASKKMFGLILIEARRPYELFEFGQLGGCQLCWSRISAKEWRSHLIHPLIRALC